MLVRTLVVSGLVASAAISVVSCSKKNKKSDPGSPGTMANGSSGGEDSGGGSGSNSGSSSSSGGGSGGGSSSGSPNSGGGFQPKFNNAVAALSQSQMRSLSADDVLPGALNLISNEIGGGALRLTSGTAYDRLAQYKYTQTDALEFQKTIQELLCILQKIPYIDVPLDSSGQPAVQSTPVEIAQCVTKAATGQQAQQSGGGGGGQQGGGSQNQSSNSSDDKKPTTVTWKSYINTSNATFVELSFTSKDSNQQEIYKKWSVEIAAGYSSDDPLGAFYAYLQQKQGGENGYQNRGVEVDVKALGSDGKKRLTYIDQDSNNGSYRRMVGDFIVSSGAFVSGEFVSALEGWFDGKPGGKFEVVFNDQHIKQRRTIPQEEINNYFGNMAGEFSINFNAAEEKCYVRGQTKFNVYQYNVFKADGSDLDVVSGFPFRAVDNPDINGWASYYGVSAWDQQNGGEAQLNGAQVKEVDYSNWDPQTGQPALKAETYTVHEKPVKVTKYSNSAIAMSALTGKVFDWVWDMADYSDWSSGKSYRVKYYDPDGAAPLDFYKIAYWDDSDMQNPKWTELSQPSPYGYIKNNPGSAGYFWNQGMGGQVRVKMAKQAAVSFGGTIEAGDKFFINLAGSQSIEVAAPGTTAAGVATAFAAAWPNTGLAADLTAVAKGDVLLLTRKASDLAISATVSSKESNDDPADAQTIEFHGGVVVLGLGGNLDASSDKFVIRSQWDSNQSLSVTAGADLATTASQIASDVNAKAANPGNLWVFYGIKAFSSGNEVILTHASAGGMSLRALTTESDGSAADEQSIEVSGSYLAIISKQEILTDAGDVPASMKCFQNCPKGGAISKEDLQALSQNWSERGRVYAGDLSKIEGYHQYSFNNFELTKSSYDLGVSGQLEAGDVLTIDGSSGQSIVLTVPNLYSYQFKGSFKDGEQFNFWGNGNNSAYISTGNIIFDFDSGNGATATGTAAEAASFVANAWNNRVKNSGDGLYDADAAHITAVAYGDMLIFNEASGNNITYLYLSLASSEEGEIAMFSAQYDFTKVIAAAWNASTHSSFTPYTARASGSAIILAPDSSGTGAPSITTSISANPSGTNSEAVSFNLGAAGAISISGTLSAGEWVQGIYSGMFLADADYNSLLSSFGGDADVYVVQENAPVYYTVQMGMSSWDKTIYLTRNSDNAVVAFTAPIVIDDYVLAASQVRRKDGEAEPTSATEPNIGKTFVLTIDGRSLNIPWEASDEMYTDFFTGQKYPVWKPAFALQDGSFDFDLVDNANTVYKIKAPFVEERPVETSISDCGAISYPPSSLADSLPERRELIYYGGGYGGGSEGMHAPDQQMDGAMPAGGGNFDYPR